MIQANETKAITSTIHDDMSGLTLAFGNGETIVIGAADLPAAIAARALWHGVSAKLVDAAAISRNPDTGRSATIDDKYNAVFEVYKRLLAGQWNKTRDGSSGGAGGLLFRALCRLYPAKTPEALRAYLEGKDAKEQAALRKVAKIAAIIEEIKAESQTDSGDGDDLLNELDDLE